MPRRFNTITVTDGIAMGHQGMKSSLVSREVIADSVELSVRGHCYDALVGFAGCDKSLPGMMMAMLRLNVPSIFVYGGSILPGRFHDTRRHRGRRVRGGRPAMPPVPARCPRCTRSRRSPAPATARAAASITANTMACVGEAIGLSLAEQQHGAGTLHHARADRGRRRRAGDGAARARTSARATSARARRSSMPRASSPRPAARPTPRCICPRWRTRRGSSSTCSTSPRSSRSTPYIADLKPGGQYVAQGHVRGRRRLHADEDAARPRACSTAIA